MEMWYCGTCLVGTEGMGQQLDLVFCGLFQPYPDLCFCTGRLVPKTHQETLLQARAAKGLLGSLVSPCHTLLLVYY